MRNACYRSVVCVSPSVVSVNRNDNSLPQKGIISQLVGMPPDSCAFCRYGYMYRHRQLHGCLIERVGVREKSRAILFHAMETRLSVLFLDIDGVLLPFPDASVDSGRIFPERNLAALKTIIASVPDLKIVLSSTWRVNETLKYEILDDLRKSGIDLEEFYDTTDPKYHADRQHEIYKYVKANETKILAWIALDDEELLDGPENKNHRAMFVNHVIKCQSNVGLTSQQASEAIGLLQAQLK